MESLEQELMTMLRNLPIPITITWRGGQYYWRCGQRTGSSSRLISAIEEPLRYLMSERNNTADTTKRKN